LVRTRKEIGREGNLIETSNPKYADTLEEGVAFEDCLAVSRTARDSEALQKRNAKTLGARMDIL
jgi:hypothetical protein